MRKFGSEDLADNLVYWMIRMHEEEFPPILEDWFTKTNRLPCALLKNFSEKLPITNYQLRLPITNYQLPAKLIFGEGTGFKN